MTQIVGGRTEGDRPRMEFGSLPPESLREQESAMGSRRVSSQNNFAPADIGINLVSHRGRRVRGYFYGPSP